MQCLRCGNELTAGQLGLCSACRELKQNESRAPKREAGQSTTDMEKPAAVQEQPKESVAEPSRPTSVEADYLEPAGFWIRFVAAIIDWSVVGVIAALFGFLLTSLLSALPSLAALTSGAAGAPPWLALITVIIVQLFVLGVQSLLVGAAYFALFEASPAQATPGKLLLGLAVTDIDFQPVDRQRAALRFACRYSFIIPMLLSLLLIVLGTALQLVFPMFLAVLLGLCAPLLFAGTHIYAAFSAERRGLHDILSGCRVMRREAVSTARIFGSIAVALVLALISSFIADTLDSTSGRRITGKSSVSVAPPAADLSSESFLASREQPLFRLPLEGGGRHQFELAADVSVKVGFSAEIDHTTAQSCPSQCGRLVDLASGSSIGSRFGAAMRFSPVNGKVRMQLENLASFPITFEVYRKD